VENKTDQNIDAGEPIDALQVDESMKLLFTADKEALILFVNNAFNRQHDINKAKLEFLASEFVSEGLEKIQADLMFMIDEYRYHLEFQTKFDKTIIIRMLEYGLSKVKETKVSGIVSDEIILEFPMPLVVQVERNDNSQDEINAYIKISGCPESLNFKVPVINMWKYGLEDIIARKWYLLIPYCLMKYRKLLKAGEVTDKQKDEFKTEMNSVMEKAHELNRSGKISSTFFPPLMSMILLISNHINEKFIHDSEIRKELAQVNRVINPLNPLGSTTIQKYLDQGKEERTIEFTVKLLKRGRALNEIIEDTDFTEDKVREIAKEYGLEIKI
jgi:hypothetical protein